MERTEERKAGAAKNDKKNPRWQGEWISVQASSKATKMHGVLAVTRGGSSRRGKENKKKSAKRGFRNSSSLISG